jgi:methylmalonyl-CoA decarboxylase
MPLISVAHVGPDAERELVVEISFMNAARRNVLGSQMLTEVMCAMAEAEVNGCRALILRAEPGVATWSAGHDILELPRDQSDPLTWTNPLEEFLRRVHMAPYPVIAAVEGGAWGGACDLAVTCDLVVATRTATFAITPAKLGIPYNTAGVNHFVGVVPLHIAKEMFFTARPIDADQAAHWGLINRLVDSSDDLTRVSRDLANTIAALAPLAIRAIKAEIASITGASAIGSDEWERLTSLRRAAWRSDDYREGISAFEERRDPTFRAR